MTTVTVATSPHTKCITIEVTTEESDYPDVVATALTYLKNNPDFPNYYIYDVETMTPHVTHFYADVEEAEQ